MKKITIGARGSQLSQAYVEKVKKLILTNTKDINVNDIEIKKIKTSGDIHDKSKLSDIGGKKLFCKEIEDELLANKIDIAIHSLKDMEGNEHDDLIIGAYIKRNDPRDALLSIKIDKYDQLNSKILIGSSSRRRELQLKKINKDISIINIRGNIDTRIKNLYEKKEVDGIILAAAGIKSLNLGEKISIIFEVDKILPAIGQGIIAAQCRKNDDYVKDLLKKINDKETSICALAERSLLKTVGGDCDTAIGGLAVINGDTIKLKAELFSDDGSESFFFEITGKDDDAINLGRLAGKKLLNLAGNKFKKK